MLLGLPQDSYEAAKFNTRSLRRQTHGQIVNFYSHNTDMTPEFAKQKSHEYLAAHGVPINETLPLVEHPLNYRRELHKMLPVERLS